MVLESRNHENRTKETVEIEIVDTMELETMETETCGDSRKRYQEEDEAVEIREIEKYR